MQHDDAPRTGRTPWTFNEDLGPGTPIDGGEDTDYFYRAYLANATLEYVPDMTVFHHHGRKTSADGKKLMIGYMIGTGAIYARYLLKHPNFADRLLGLQECAHRDHHRH